MAKVNNLAYDYSIYEPLPQKEPEKRIQVRKNTAVDQKVSAAKAFITAVAAMFLLCAILNGKVEISKLYNEQSNLNKQLNSITSENTSLKTELDGKTSIQAVEDYAENTLGLQKLDNSQKEYIQLQKNNVIEVVKDDNDNVFVSVKNWFKDALEYIGA